MDDDQAVFVIREGRIDYDQLILLSPYQGLRQLVSAVSPFVILIDMQRLRLMLILHV